VVKSRAERLKPGHDKPAANEGRPTQARACKGKEKPKCERSRGGKGKSN
jgi:hypothetical protein